MKKIFIYTVGAFIVLLFIGFNSNIMASTVNEKSYINEMEKQNYIISAKDLYDEFKLDEAAAIEKYAGRQVTVKGVAVYIGPDVYALPSVELAESNDGKSRILCVLPFSDYFKLRKVSKGNEVTITGELRGFYEKGDQVLFKECEINEITK